MKLFAVNCLMINKIDGGISNTLGLRYAECEEDVIADMSNDCLHSPEWTEPQILVVECCQENVGRLCPPATVGAYI